jgi:plasmid stability protein
VPRTLVQTLVPPEMAASVKHRAAADDRSVSSWLRGILRQVLEAENSEVAVAGDLARVDRDGDQHAPLYVQ